MNLGIVGFYYTEEYTGIYLTTVSQLLFFSKIKKDVGLRIQSSLQFY